MTSRNNNRNHSRTHNNNIKVRKTKGPVTLTNTTAISTKHVLQHLTTNWSFVVLLVKPVTLREHQEIMDDSDNVVLV